MMTSTIPLLFLLALTCLDVSHSLVSTRPSRHRPAGASSSSTALNYIDDHDMVAMDLGKLPSLSQVSSDSFTDQTYHASTLVNELVASLEKKTELQNLVTAQLSHKDGIRGFFAVYLSRSAADVGVMPGPLTYALKGVDMDKSPLAAVACMNLIRTTVMADWHTDTILKENSQRTAHRSKKILENLKGQQVIRNCNAIYTVASGRALKNAAPSSGKSDNESQNNSSLEEFWAAVFLESGFDEKQEKAIAAAFFSLIQL